MRDKQVCQVIVTVPDREAALVLGRSAVEARLAACAQVGGPIRSVYRWTGAVEEADEWTVVFKTTADRYQGLEGFVRDNHPYEVPEILCTPVSAGNPDYLEWVAGN